MTHSPSFAKETLPRGGVRFVLPRRHWSVVVSGYAAVPIAFAFAAIAVVNVLISLGVLELGVPPEEQLYSLPFGMLFGLGACYLGFRVIPNQIAKAVIELQDGQLRQFDRAGALASTQEVPVERIESLAVVRYPYRRSVDNPAGRSGRFPSNLAALEILLTGDESVELAEGYPREVLSPLARALAESLPGGSVRVDDLWPEEKLALDLQGRPADSPIQVEQRGDAAHIVVPPPGIWKGTGRMLQTLLIIAALGTILSLIVLTAARFTTSDIPYFPLGLLSWIWCILMFGVFHAIDLGTRRVTCQASATGLAIEQRGLFGRDRRRWDRSAVKAISPGFGLIHSKHTTEMELHVYATDGTRFGLLPGRSDAELQWLATLLREQLNVPASPAGEGSSALRFRSRMWQPLAALFGLAITSGLSIVAGFYFLAGLIAGPAREPLANDKHRFRPIHVLTGHRQSVTSLSIAPDGKRLATSSTDGTVRIWDLASGAALHVCRGHHRFVNSVEYSPDGLLIASAGDDETIRIWSAEDGSAQKVLKGHRGKVLDVAFSSDGRQLASVSSDWTVRLWDVAKGVGIAVMTGHSGPPQAVAFHKEGRLLASSAIAPAGKADGGETILWDLDSAIDKHMSIREGEQWKTVPIESRAVHARLKHPNGAAADVVFAPDGTRFVTSGIDDTVRLWDLDSRQVIDRWTAKSGPLAFSRDGRQLVMTDSSRTVEVYNLESGERLHAWAAHAGQVNGLAFTPNGSELITCGQDMTIKAWSLAAATADQ